MGSTCTCWEQNRMQLWAQTGKLVILDISCVLNRAFAINESEILVSCMCKAGRRMNTMEWSNLVTFHGLRTGVDEGLGSAGWPSSTHAGHSLKQKLLLIALQSCPRCCSIMPCSRLLSSYCSASFHFSLLLLLNTTLPCKSLMHFCVTQSVLWKQSSSCGLPEPRVCAPWLGQRGGIRAAKKFSPSKNINCNVASGSREILLKKLVRIQSRNIWDWHIIFWFWKQ